ncbi:hypothetical protein JCM10212_006159, partial [Sporobolomyces blumeae]
NDPLDGPEVITVKDKATGRVIWTKSRDLAEDEIVSTVYDSMHQIRFTIHRPRQPSTTSTRRATPPRPPYLVLRSPYLVPHDSYIPLIDLEPRVEGARPFPDKGKGRAENDDDVGGFEFRLSMRDPTRRAAARATSANCPKTRPADLDLDGALPDPLGTVARARTRGEQDDQEDDPRTPTTARPERASRDALSDEGEETPRRITDAERRRPHSASYRVEMVPSLSQGSDTSRTSSLSDKVSIASASSSALDGSTSSDSVFVVVDDQDEPDLATASPTTRLFETFSIRRSIPKPFASALDPSEGSNSLGSRWLGGFGRVVSYVTRADEPKRWSCVRTDGETAPSLQGGRSATDTSIGSREGETGPEDDGDVVMAFVEDTPSLMPTPFCGTLTLSPSTIDASGYEPSFWIAVAMSWIELERDRDGWTVGRGGD